MILAWIVSTLWILWIASAAILLTKVICIFKEDKNDDLLNCRIEALGINDLFVIITRKKVLGKYRYVKLPHFALSDYQKSEFYQLKSATDATVFKNKHEANYFNPDPELFEVVPKNY